MSRIAQVILTIALSLWLGGLVALFLFVSVLFKTDRTTATLAAPVLFNSFARYQLMFGAVALLAAVLLQVTRRSQWTLPIIATILAAGVAALILQFSTIPEMEQLRAAGESAGPRFRKLHQLSSIYFVCEAIVLLIAVIILPLAFDRRDPRARTAHEPASATGSRA